MLVFMVGPLLDALGDRARYPYARLHVPGHQGHGLPSLVQRWGAAVFGDDQTELDDLDNLAAPAGVIQAAQGLAATTFGARRTWFLVNGATVGVQAALWAVAGAGDKVIVPRNAHQSAIAALILSGATPILITPEVDPDWDLPVGISADRLAAALAAHPDAKAVFLVSPTYHGIASEVGAIADLTRSHGIPLIVDEAHGSHWITDPRFPTPALAAGANLVIQSPHKTLGSLTQSALLHLGAPVIGTTAGTSVGGIAQINAETNADRLAQRVTQALGWLHSSSPSYLLLASLDAMRDWVDQAGAQAAAAAWARAERVGAWLTQRGVPWLERGRSGVVPGFADLDPLRLTVRVDPWGWTGYAADTALDQRRFAAPVEDPTPAQRSDPAPCLSTDPIPEDPIPEDPIPEDPIPEDPIPEDPIPEDPIPENSTQEDPTPENLTQENSTQEDPTPEDPTPENSTQEDPTQEDLTRKNSAWGESYGLPVVRSPCGVAAELVSDRTMTFLITHFTTDQDIHALLTGLDWLATHPPGDRAPIAPPITLPPSASLPPITTLAMTPRDAAIAPRIAVPLEQAVGQISAEAIAPYPPGIPVLLPGERIRSEAIAVLRQAQATGITLVGNLDPALEHLWVCVESAI